PPQATGASSSPRREFHSTPWCLCLHACKSRCALGVWILPGLSPDSFSQTRHTHGGRLEPRSMQPRAMLVGSRGNDMPSFDIVIKADLQEVDNALNQARKE